MSTTYGALDRWLQPEAPVNHGLHTTLKLGRCARFQDTYAGLPADMQREACRYLYMHQFGGAARLQYACCSAPGRSVMHPLARSPHH